MAYSSDGGEGSEGGLSRAIIASAQWYSCLARILSGSFSPNHIVALTSELTERLDVDSTLILRYPPGEAPRVLYDRTHHKHRVNKIEDYVIGHYALDPFYLRIQHCAQQGFMPLREVIEEDFSSSEYYKVHYSSAGLLDEMCFCCADGEGGFINLSLSRILGRTFFSASELDAARSIAPLVNGVLRETWRSFSLKPAPAVDVGRGDHHRRIENARLNFGRSVLTDREFEILQFLLHGKSIEFIANRLDIAISTVKVHRKHIYSKLNINAQAELFTLFLDVVSATVCEKGEDPLAGYRPPSLEPDER